MSAEAPTFSELRAWAAVGARVGLLTCLDCGAAILVDPSDPVGESGREIHVRWHLERP